MLAELREQFLAEFVITARSRIKSALALLPPAGPGGDRSIETIERLMHTTAGEATMIGLSDITAAARAAQAAAKRCLSPQGSSPLLLIGCARALRSLAVAIDGLNVTAPAADNKAPESRVDRATPKDEPGGPGRVLLVDDSPFNAAVLCDALTERGVRAVAVRDDLQQALSQLADLHPHVVLIDAIMPKLDPKDLRDAIRADAKNAGIQLVLFTALDPQEAAQQARAAAVDGFITKELGIDAIVARVCALLPGARP
ncbi:MAG: response regulator [Myxococcales bacterium]|nr:response regulator [Myxococcales bacterium]